MQINRALYVYKSKRGGQADLTLRIKQIAETRVRYGYRRIHVLLLREGRHVNVKRVYRLYRELGLQLRHKPPKRRVKAKLREDRVAATRPNDTWAMDFVHDQLATGKKLRVLTVVDIFSKFSPVVDPRFNYRAEDVVLTLEKVCSKIGYPKTIRVDRDRSSSPVILICGPIIVVSFWTSQGQENRLIMPSFAARQRFACKPREGKVSTASSEPSV